MGKPGERWALRTLLEMEYPYHQYFTKTNRTLGFLRKNLHSCPQDMKEAAYKTLVRPILEYGSSFWNPYTQGLQDELEKVQNCAARFVSF